MRSLAVHLDVCDCVYAPSPCVRTECLCVFESETKAWEQSYVGGHVGTVMIFRIVTTVHHYRPHCSALSRSSCAECHNIKILCVCVCPCLSTVHMCVFVHMSVCAMSCLHALEAIQPDNMLVCSVAPP